MEVSTTEKTPDKKKRVRMFLQRDMIQYDVNFFLNEKREGAEQTGKSLQIVAA